MNIDKLHKAIVTNNKPVFHSEGKKILKELAANLKLTEFDVRSCKGGPGVMGEVILHTPTMYMQISADISPTAPLMFRTCKGMKDYCGGPNNWGTLNILQEPERFRRFLA